MKIRPLADRIIVQRVETSEGQVGGIIIPDSAKEKPLQGKVIAAGSGKIWPMKFDYEPSLTYAMRGTDAAESAASPGEDDEAS